MIASHIRLKQCALGFKLTQESMLPSWEESKGNRNTELLHEPEPAAPVYMLWRKKFTPTWASRVV